MKSHKIIILICFAVLFYGADVSAVKHSSQFPQEPQQTLPPAVKVYPVTQPSNTTDNTNLNQTDANPDATQDNQNNLEAPEAGTNAPDQQALPSQNNLIAKKSNSISGQVISFMIFFLCILAVIFSFVLLKRKKML